MRQTTESNIKTFGPLVLGFLFAVLQGFTVYYTKNVDNRIADLATKQERTWEITLVTKTELATLRAQQAILAGDMKDLEAQLQETREALLRATARSPQ
ncbi:MAG: hypothetical protein CMK92_05260 [Pseudomonas sp.]|nr:hypothetical protein [Pseudomonas sp.]